MNLIIPDAGCVEHLVSVDDTARGEVTGVYRTACGVWIERGSYVVAYLQDCPACHATECRGARRRRDLPMRVVMVSPPNTVKDKR